MSKLSHPEIQELLSREYEGFEDLSDPWTQSLDEGVATPEWTSSSHDNINFSAERLGHLWESWPENF